MTYNTHGCRGLDRKIDEARVGAVLAEVGADLIALQEIDVGRRRSRYHDQAQMLADQLGFAHVFSSARKWRVGAYGNAVLSRYPVDVVREAHLPRPRGLPVETRSAQVTQVTLPSGRQLGFLNTHLGLLRFERLRQIRWLLANGWVDEEALVMCGDLNSRPKSAEIRLLRQKLQVALPLAPTFPVRFPLIQLDYFLHGASLEASVQACFVHRSALAREASDHYPLVMDLSL